MVNSARLKAVLDTIATLLVAIAAMAVTISVVTTHPLSPLNRATSAQRPGAQDISDQNLKTSLTQAERSEQLTSRLALVALDPIPWTV